MTTPWPPRRTARRQLARRFAGWRARRRREVPRPGTEQPTRPADEREIQHRSPGRRLRSLVSARSVAGQVFLLQLAVVVLLVVATVVTLVVQAQHQGTEKARDEVLAVAEAFANSPGIVQALDSHDPSTVLQPLTERARKRSGVDGIVVISTDGIRYTHPDPHQIGKHVVKGDPYRKAVRGTALTDSEVTPLGVSVFAEVPVFRPDGSVSRHRVPRDQGQEGERSGGRAASGALWRRGRRARPGRRRVGADW